MNSDAQLIIVAGGIGIRLGYPLPKALVPIAGTPLIVHTLNAFVESTLNQTAIIVHPEKYRDEFEMALQSAFPHNTCSLVTGGEERDDSVAKGLAALADATAIVLIHDAARPFTEHTIIQESIDVARRDGAATVVCDCKDTVLQADENEHLLTTPDRSTLRMCQTPQVFKRAIIESAYASPASSAITDDATRVHSMGVPVSLVKGTDRNIKITTQQDVEYAEFLLEKGHL